MARRDNNKTAAPAETTPEAAIEEPKPDEIGSTRPWPPPPPDVAPEVPPAQAFQSDAPAAASAPADLATLKANVTFARQEEARVFEALRQAREATAFAENALCEHVMSLRKDDKRVVEIAIGEERYRPRFFQETKEYRLDRAPSHERTTF